MGTNVHFECIFKETLLVDGIFFLRFINSVTLLLVQYISIHGEKSHTAPVMIVFTNCSPCLNDLARHNNGAINCISLSGAGFRSWFPEGGGATTECMTGQAALQTGHLLDGGLPTDDGYVHMGNTPSCSDTPITQWKHSKLKGQFTQKLKRHTVPLTCSAIHPSGLFWCELLSFRDNL